MAKEIERKFLVKNDHYKNESSITHRIRQGYIYADKSKVVRIRISDSKAYITIKDQTTGLTRNEWEYEIPLADAKEILDKTCSASIEKKRWIVPSNNQKWEIDEFQGDNQGLVIAEIELQNENETIQKPDWLGEEVTGEPRYYNAELYKNPYKNWK